ncbi:MAG: orotidine 5'-phosphate decarboxylase [Peptococcaceae bacterium BICA1-7]|nr:MAG: orotidine 5'-phosphate decarboxylase [Peptococcaceae bacterium BICA1-7]HBV96517.1 orotidine-5'-phosphate decarboxylase [Desulfotomaculum sp.]
MKYNPLIVALDVDSRERALELVDSLRDRAGMFKVGMELFYGTGGGIVREIKNMGCRVFLDLKLHDIPNTVSRASRVLTALGPDIINVHASGGPEMMREAARAVKSEASLLGVSRPLVIAVTVLTSINKEIFNSSLGIAGEVEETVVRWAVSARDCGLDGVVASPREVSSIRKACGNDFVIVTPGIRPAGAEAGDQKRVMTPAGAVQEGATYIVVGRPVTGSSDPAEAAGKIIEEIEGRVF